MHPLLTGRLRPLLYLRDVGRHRRAARRGDGRAHAAPDGQAAIFIGPLALFYAFVCLSAWWVVPREPACHHAAAALLAVIAGGSIQAAALWVGLGALHAALLSRFATWAPTRIGIFRDLGVLGIAGIVLYAQSMAAHYFLLSIETARSAERQVFASQVTAREPSCARCAPSSTRTFCSTA